MQYRIAILIYSIDILRYRYVSQITLSLSYLLNVHKSSYLFHDSFHHGLVIGPQVVMPTITHWQHLHNEKSDIHNIKHVLYSMHRILQLEYISISIKIESICTILLENQNLVTFVVRCIKICKGITFKMLLQNKVHSS